MSLTPEQTAIVSSWVAAGDNLSAVQKKLLEQFKITLTYRDVRFLVDDLNLALKDPAPKVDTSDVSKTPPPAVPKEKPAAKKAAPAPAPAADEVEAEGAPLDAPEAAEGALDELPAEPSSVTVTVDDVTLVPGAIAGGTVTFSDGVTGKWIIDQQYRPGFTQISQPGYRPSPADAQAFMDQLGQELQKRGL